LLGGSLESIAREKAGIIKPGTPVIVGKMADEAARVIERTCRDLGARFISAERDVRVSSRLSAGCTMATFQSGGTRLTEVTLALNGRHQVQNAAIVLRLLDELVSLGVPVDAAAMRSGLTDARWPGRLEHVSWRGADVLLDAAHNPAGAKALADYLDDTGWTDVTIVAGVMRDKDATGMLSALLPYAGSLICTTPASPRALPADELAASARSLPGAPSRVLSITDPAMAIAEACRSGARVVAAGSIFLIGPLRGILR
jgi:dihydrofolate synthase/folylpolyglutamate synthase